MTFSLTKITSNGSYAFWECHVWLWNSIFHWQWKSQPVKQYCWWVMTLVLLIHLADGNKQNVYFRPQPNKGAAVRCTGVHLIRHKVEQHMPSWRGDTVTYNQVICDLESSWIETCKSEWDILWTSWSVQKYEVVETPGHCRWREGHDHRTERKSEWPPWHHDISARPGAGHDRKQAIHPNMLPTKCTATKYHILRVFKQVQQWQGNTLQAADWGCELCGGRLKPMKLWPRPSVTFWYCVMHSCKTGCITLCCGCWDVRLLVLDAETFAKHVK